MPFAKDENGKENIYKVCICCSYIMKIIYARLAKNFGIHGKSGVHAKNLALYIELSGEPDLTWITWTKQELDFQNSAFSETHALLQKPAILNKSTPKTQPSIAVSNRSSNKSSPKRKLCAEKSIVGSEKTLEEWKELFKGGLIT